MKRRWIGLIILLAVGMSIIGVSKQQRPVQSEDESITLRVVLWDYDVVIYDRELIENFEKDHPDIKIDVISYPPTYYNSSLTALLDSGETVDVIYVNQLDQLSQITDRNLAMPLDSYIRRDGVPTEHYPGLDVLRGLTIFASWYCTMKPLTTSGKGSVSVAGKHPLKRCRFRNWTRYAR